jgi:Kef-type K+ transport system membrane component KefB
MNYSFSVDTMHKTILFVDADYSAHLNFLLVLGIAVFCATIGARIFQKLHIPQMVGYIVVGILVGRSALNK